MQTKKSCRGFSDRRCGRSSRTHGRFRRLYTQGFERGVSTGLRTLDPLYTVVPGEVTVVSGIGNSGKSNVIDQILVNIAELRNWNFALSVRLQHPLAGRGEGILVGLGKGIGGTWKLCLLAPRKNQEFYPVPPTFNRKFMVAKEERK